MVIVVVLVVVVVVVVVLVILTPPKNTAGKGKGSRSPSGPTLSRARVSNEPVTGEVTEWKGGESEGHGTETWISGMQLDDGCICGEVPGLGKTT